MDSEHGFLDRFRHHFTEINRELDRSLLSRVPLIVEIGRHSLLGEGKRLRPLLFVLACRLCGYPGKDVYRFSTVFECIHVASLLHDDVLDNAELRRKKPSARSLWGNSGAILGGDFLYAQAVSTIIEKDNLRLFRV
ncbi:MAG: polyprenyl synthetase family protein, partial [Deltaproteobacteria bacterium]|nr:polyprenyl synthetase family protein [Deltaproteobacteria bacterium]